MTYPNHAGWTEPTTSRKAALAVEASGRAPTIRQELQALFEAGWRGTAEDAAVVLGKGYRSVQPRISELRAADVIKADGERMGPEGKNIAVWCLK